MNKLGRLALCGCCALQIVACSSNYQYTRPDLPLAELPNSILLAVDYLAIRDDLGRRWDFDENAHQAALSQADRGLVAAIESHGFSVSNQTLISSGLWLDPRLEVDHYLDGRQQPDPIHPPFLIASEGLSEVSIEALADLYPLLARQLAGIEVDADRLREFNLFNYRQQAAEVNPLGDHLLLVVQYHDPSTSLMKQLGLLLIGVGASEASDYGYASFDLEQQDRAKSFAYLIDTRSGQLLWKNTTPGIDLSESGITRLFDGFPEQP